MAIVSMADAVAGAIASSTEYNKLIDNIQDLDARLGAVVSASTAHARLTSLETITAHGTSGNAALNTRVGSLETLTTNTATNGGHGNVQLSTRLGTGVTTASTATAQFATLTSGLSTANGNISTAQTNITTLQGQVGAAPASPNLHSRVSTLEAASGSLGPTLYQIASGFVSTTSTTPVALSGDPGLAFTGPSTGKVLIMAGGRATAGVCQLMFEIRQGSTIGSGTVVTAADLNASGDFGSRSWLVSGLTSGASYNVRVMYASSNGASNGWAQRHITLIPSA